MAEVLPPLMQPSSTITMLHTRPSSADAFQGSASQYSQSSRLGQTPRGIYNAQNGYKAAASPVQPYAFQSTPHLRQETRTISAPVSSHGPIGGHRHAPTPSTSSSDTGSVPSGKDDSVIGSRPGSTINLSAQLPDLSFTPFDTQSVKPSPDRYHRPTGKRADSSNSASNTVKSAAPSGSGMASVAHLYQQPAIRQSSLDDLSVTKASNTELAKRYRRRSLNTLDTQSHLNAPAPDVGIRRPSTGSGATSTPTTIRPVSFYSNSGSEDNEAVPRNASMSSLNKVESSKSSNHSQENIKPAAAAKTVVVPQRVSSEANKRLAAPSPLSRQATDSESQASPAKPKTYASVAAQAIPVSPAAKQLAALSDKDLNKGMKSRLRRAFSFGSAQELRRAAGENQQTAQYAAHNKELHQNRIEDEMDAEQLEIARRQEAAGIGAGIYSGQGGFLGSTDNLSISSTASSASMMLRKMGQGARKSARSIKGLFRPKSVIGVPAADGPIVQPSVAQVSMVTVEAERHRVNVNDAGDNAGGVTAFPKLERNSIDAANAASALSPSRRSADGSDSFSRRSVIGSDKDRAEVLAAVKKGILKRSGTSSPNGSPVIRAADGTSPSVDSPPSSRPGTPNTGLRTGSLNGDYFNQRVVSMAKSMPNTPLGSVRSISFSPRIQFHEAWAAAEYDRRGEIATCNRLTPMLAQQIKEELNTFKMEMEVHELSKPHTHFF